MSASCSRCGTPQAPGARFCARCGAPLAAAAGGSHDDRTRLVPTGASAVRRFVVGRASDCDLVLDIPTISGHHFSLTLSGGEYVVEDLGSTNGTFLNARGHRIARPTAVSPSDVLLLGSYRLPVTLLLSRLGLGETRSGASVRATLGDKPMVVGRAPDCDLVVAYPQVSAHHARLTPQPDGSILVEDLGSTNGTYVDGRRIQRAVVRPGVKLSLASVPLVLDAHRGVQAAPLRGTVRVDAIGLQRVVRHRVTGEPLVLLDDVSISIYPSELVAIMGPSGAGKTTLLMALNGYEPPDRGEVRLAGENLYANFDRFRGLVGYVPQDDLLFKELTVREALYFTARLRLPDDTTDAEIHDCIERVLADLKLTAQADQLIGSVEEKVLSGGQRKRVNIALELITDPEVLFLDEPTSGLSAKDAADLVEVLRQLADRGRTVILTIHQPSAEIFARMDHVLLLANGGRVAFFGPTEPDSYAFMQVQQRNPDLLLERLEDASPEQWAQRYRNSKYYAEYVDKRLGGGDRGDGQGSLRPRPRVSATRQFVTLLRRYATIKVRDRLNAFMLAAQAPIVGGLIAWLFHDYDDKPVERAVPLFILVVAAIFFGCFNSSREVVAERAMFRRERMVNLLVGPWLLSKFLLLSAVGVVQAAFMLLVVVPSVGLEGDPVAFFGILAATSVAATAMGLLLSTLVKSTEAAMAIVPMVLIPQIVLSGFLVPLERDDVKVPAALMLSRWATEAMFDVEAEGIGPEPSVPPLLGARQGRVDGAGRCLCPPPVLPKPTFRGRNIEHNHLETGRRGFDVAAIGLMLLACMAVTWSLLVVRHRR